MFWQFAIPVDDLGVSQLGLKDQMLSHPAMLNLRTDLDPLNFQVMLWESIRQGPMPPAYSLMEKNTTRVRHMVKRSHFTAPTCVRLKSF